jgi:hypothetical protein
VTESVFKTACEKVNGKLGTSGSYTCCSTPNGGVILKNGQMVPGTCNAGGLGKTVLIAGAAVAAILLMKVL